MPSKTLEQQIAELPASDQQLINAIRDTLDDLTRQLLAAHKRGISVRIASSLNCVPAQYWIGGIGQ